MGMRVYVGYEAMMTDMTAFRHRPPRATHSTQARLDMVARSHALIKVCP